jgi:hypothetical protein
MKTSDIIAIIKALGYFPEVVTLPMGVETITIPFSLRVDPKTISEFRTVFKKTHYVNEVKANRTKHFLLITPR